MKVGINYAWKNYGWDFGEPPRKNPASCGADGRRGATHRRRSGWLRRAGLLRGALVPARRWHDYGVGERAAADARTAVEGDRDPRAAAGLRRGLWLPLVALRHARLQLVPSLVDFHLAFPALPVAGSDGILKAGRSALITDPDLREQFWIRRWRRF